MINPVAFNIFGIEIRWYGILMSAAIFIATLISNKRADKYGMKKDLIFDLFLYVVPAAIIGARVYYVIFEWKQYINNPLEIFNYRAGGLAIHGALIFGFISGYIFAKKNNINPLKLSDIVAPTIALGQAIGRWGNFINMEAHGGPTNLPWGIVINGQKVHPTFLYESLWDLGIFIFIILYMDKRKKFDGQLIFIYGILYSIGRFFIEGLRTDSLMFGPLKMAQLISIFIIIVCTYLYNKYSKLNRR